MTADALPFTEQEVAAGSFEASVQRDLNHFRHFHQTVVNLPGDLPYYAFSDLFIPLGFQTFEKIILDPVQDPVHSGFKIALWKKSPDRSRNVSM